MSPGRPLFQSPHKRGGSRDSVNGMLVFAWGNPFQSPHKRGGSRDDHGDGDDGDGPIQRFNPLISGADRATQDATLTTSQIAERVSIPS